MLPRQLRNKGFLEHLQVNVAKCYRDGRLVPRNHVFETTDVAPEVFEFRPVLEACFRTLGTPSEVGKYRFEVLASFRALIQRSL